MVLQDADTERSDTKFHQDTVLEIPTPDRSRPYYNLILFPLTIQHLLSTQEPEPKSVIAALAPVLHPVHIDAEMYLNRLTLKKLTSYVENYPTANPSVLLSDLCKTYPSKVEGGVGEEASCAKR